MLKFVVTLGLLLAVTASDEPEAPPGASSKEKLAKVVMPEVDSNGVLQSVNAENCVDKSIYKSMSRLEEIHDEQGYLCAYIAFQANKDPESGTGLYSSKDEATKRYKIFKESVDEVNRINTSNLSWTAEINKFSDMTREERDQYLGLRMPPHLQNTADDMPALGGGAPFGAGRGRGLGMGAPH